MFNKILLSYCFLLLAFGGTRLDAQGLFPCGPNNASSTCATSCINCDLNGLTGINNVPLPPGSPNSMCHDQLILNNPRWYGFIAGSTSLTLAITPSNCQTGAGLEAAIMDNCTGIPACLPGPVILNPAGAFILSVAGLVVGQQYQLLIDGFNGDICNFSIAVVNGTAVAPPLGAVGSITGNAQVCPNGTATYAIAPVSNAISYTWSAPVGASINGGSNVRTLPAAGNNSVDITFGNSGGNVCVTASNACSTPVTTCFSVSNTPIPITILPEEIICYQQIPYEWPEAPNNILAAPGTYTLTSTPYESYLGCDSIVRQTLKVLPLNQVNLPVRYLCKDECYEINGLLYCETGYYQETLTSVNGCDSLVNFTLIRIQSKAVIQPPDTITCAVTSVPLSGAGSTTGNTVTYRWLDPNGQTISNSINAVATMPGEHALIVTNFIGGVLCRDTAFMNVPGNLTPPLAQAGPDMVLTCVTTQVQLQGSGSLGPNYSYFWKTLLGGNIVSGATTLTPIVNAPGTYSLRVTDLHNGCTAVSNAVVTANITPPSVNAAGGAYTCAQPNLTLQLNTNAPNPTFSWAGPNGFTSTLQNPSVNVAGTYTVTITHGVNGCTNSGSVVVVDNTAPPALTATGGGITCIASSVTLNASSPVQGVQYQWSGPNNFNSTLPSPTVSTLGDYQVVATAPNGCTSSAVATVFLNNNPPGTVLNSTSSLNCNNNVVNLLATSNGNLAFLTHQWTLPGGAVVNTGNQAFLQADVPGLYSINVVNTATGCSSTASFNLPQYGDVNASISAVSNANCATSADGSASVAATGGDSQYNYAWSNGATSATNANIGAGVYFVTVTDSEGCSATASVTITAPSVLNANTSGTDQTSINGTEGSATANPEGGVPSYTFLWSTGDTISVLTSLLPGAYTVTVTDANGCTDVETVNVSPVNCLLQSSVVAVNISCFGEQDGAASLNINGAQGTITYLWSNAETSSSIDSLPAGQYAVTISDEAGCSEVQNFSITEPTALQANATGSTTTGANTNDGTAAANPSGGTGTYTFSWSTGDTTPNLSGLAPGAYRVTVTDENGCSDQQTVEVLAGTCGLGVDLILIQPSCSYSTDGVVTLVLTGGSGNFVYNWSSGGTEATESNLPVGTHQVSVTDEAGCQLIETIELAGPPAITIDLLAVQSTGCAAAPEGSAEIVAGGGVGDLNIAWSNGQNTALVQNLSAGTYVVVVTDQTGCSNSLSVSIQSSDTEAPVLTAADITLPIGPTGDVVLTQQNTGVLAADNCNISNVSFDPAVFNCNELGVQVVTVIAADDSGNSATQTMNVTVVDNTPPTLICSPSLVLCFDENPVTYQAPTASDNCFSLGGSFNILEGLPIGAVFPVGSTTTTYQYTDAQGNTGTCSFEVTILPEFTLAVDTVINDFNFQTNGAIFIDVAGSLPPYTYSWTLNGIEVATTQDIAGVPAGDYTIVITDDNGCTVSQIITIDNTSAAVTPSLLGQVQVFPNPTSGIVQVLLPAELLNTEVNLQAFDLTGRRVLAQQAMQTLQTQLDFDQLPDGMYTLVIRAGNTQVIRKIVLQK